MNKKQYKTYHVYTDGSCLNNHSDRYDPNRSAGYGVYFGPDSPYNCFGHVRGRQTSQNAEMVAILVALKICLKIMKSGNQKCKFNIYTDSQYSINLIYYMVVSLSNTADLCNAIINEIESNASKVVIRKVVAHSGNHHNDMADKLASQGSHLI